MTVDPSPTPSSGQIQLAAEVTQTWRINSNLHSEVVITTKDRIKVVLMETLPRLRQVVSLTGPGSLFLGLLTGLVTSDFDSARYVLGIPSSAWATIFTIGTVASLVWFAWSVYHYKTKSVTMDQIVDKLVATHQAEPSDIVQGSTIQEE